MRILWFNHRDLRHPLAGGAEKTIHQISKRLVKMGHDVTVASVNPGGMEDFEVIEGVNICRTRGNVMAHFSVPRVIRKVNPDIVVDDLAHAVPWASTLFTDREVVVFFRHLHARSLPGQIGPVMSKIIGFTEKSYKFLYKKNPFVTETDSGVKDLVRLGISRNNVKKILPGVDKNVFRPCDKTSYPSLIYFGGLKDYKRPWLALDLLKTIGDENVKLRIVGNGPSLAKVMKMSEDKNLSGSVVFLGRVSDDELPRIIGESWINLHFSVTEGFGLTIIESASSATPTVALNAPGVSDVVNGYGLGTTASNVEDMGKEIKKVLDDYESWRSRVYNNSSSFSWEAAAAEWEKMFSSLLSTRVRTSPGESRLQIQE